MTAEQSRLIQWVCAFLRYHGGFICDWILIFATLRDADQDEDDESVENGPDDLTLSPRRAFSRTRFPYESVLPFDLPSHISGSLPDPQYADGRSSVGDALGPQ